MADNTELNAGSGGDTISTDDLGTVKVQRVKIQYGTDGNATDVSDTNPLPIDDAGGSITVDGTITANLSATDNAVLDQIEVNTSYGDNTGGGTESGALRVTIANDSTGVLSVDDGGGALTVDNGGTFAVQADSTSTDDATFTAGSGNGTPMMGFATSDTVDAGDVGVVAMDTSRNLKVSIEADNAGIGGGTQYTEDDAAPANPVGTAMMMERDDALAGLTPVEGDWTHPYATAEGALWTQDFNSDAILADTNTLAGAVAGSEMQVDIVAGLTQLTDIETNTDFGATTGNGTATGALRVTVASDTTGVLSVDDNGGSLTVDNGGTFAVQAASAGDVAHDSADSGNPMKVGGKAYAFDGTAPGTDVAEGDRVDASFTVDGRQFVEITHPNHWTVSADYAAAQTNATIKAAPGAGLKLYVTDVIISNGATAGNVTLLDGSGGTVLLEIYPAINGGMTHSFRTPIPLTANTLLAITSTTVTTHSVTICGFTAA